MKEKENDRIGAGKGREMTDGTGKSGIGKRIDECCV